MQTTPVVRYRQSSYKPTPYVRSAYPLRSMTPVMAGGLLSKSAYPPSTAPDTTLQDHFLDPKHNLSSQQALGLFLGGFTLGFGGKAMWNYLRASGKKVEQEVDFEILPGIENKKKNVTLQTAEASADIAQEAIKPLERNMAVYQNYNDPLSSIYRIVHMDPSQSDAMKVYVAASVLGYLSGSVVQGSKETWVRREETRIRARLVERLQGVLRQSIQNKKQYDALLKVDLRTRLADLLQKYGVPNVPELVQEVPIVESWRIQRDSSYQPTFRTANPALVRTGDSLMFQGVERPWGVTQSAEKPSRLLAWQKALIFGGGVFSGLVVHGFNKLLKNKNSVDVTKSNRSVWESIQLKDMETWSLIGIRNTRNFAIMSGFFAMSAAAHIGKALLDGLREVEVTRLNARTELDYQTHNWLSQDPAFHKIAEQETANHDLAQLERDLPRLIYNPVLLRQRVQAILTNVGRNSAPPYFSMTPMVNLVEARG